MAAFRGWTIKSKLSILSLLFAVGFAAFGVLAYRTLSLVQVNGPIYAEIVSNKDLVADILPPPEYLIETYLVAFQMLDESNPDALKAFVDKAKSLRDDYETRHAFWMEQLREPDLRDKMLVASYEPGIRFLDILEKDFIPAVLNGDHERAVGIARGTLKQNYLAHRAAIDDVVQMANDKTAHDEETANQLIASRTRWLVALGIVLLAVVLGCSQLIARGINRRLGKVVAFLRDIADGDLTQRLTAESTDEIGTIASALNQTIARMSAAIGEIKRSITGLGESSTRLTAVSDQLSSSAENTAEHRVSISAAAEEVDRSSQGVATALEEMTTSITEISKAAAEAATVASTAVEATDATNAAVSRLGSSSAEIGHVVKVINEIAEQTNLLALNATIEAARAGELGKGFAVVANEVKDLAKQTAQATGEIGSRIEATQSDARGAVDAIGRIGEIIHRIHGISNGIAAAVEEQVATTTEMMRSANDAARGRGEVAQGLQLLANATDTSSSAAHDASSASADLASMAAGLRQLVSQFRVAT
jgi:methyl-accepting chemotaxis protein